MQGIELKSPSTNEEYLLPAPLGNTQDVQLERKSTSISTMVESHSGTTFKANNATDIADLQLGPAQFTWDALRYAPPEYLNLDVRNAAKLLSDSISIDTIQLDPLTEAMCVENNILQYIKPIYDIIYEAYEGVNSVDMELTEDPEIPNYQKICFEIHLTGEPSQILEDEKTLYTLFFEKVPEDKEHFFVFTYWVI